MCDKKEKSTQSVVADFRALPQVMTLSTANKLPQTQNPQQHHLQFHNIITPEFFKPDVESGIFTEVIRLSYTHHRNVE